MRLLRMVGLAEKALNYPDELSGGQKQRIAIARALAMDPEIILFDEPTSALDPTMVEEVQSVIRDLAKTGKTLMIVTHEMNFARAISNRVFFMDEGGIYEDGTPEQIFEHPVRENTRRFIRKLKVLEFLVDSKDFDFLGAATEIDKYVTKNRIPWKTCNRVHMAFDELLQELLIPVLDNPRVRATIEYSETGTTVITVGYNGPESDVTVQERNLAVGVLNAAIAEYKYAYNEGEEYPNQLILRVRGEDE